jgi:hypothetical protein
MSRPPEPITPQRAANLRMQGGKYKNMKIREIGEMDRQYLAWLADFAGPGIIQQAASVHLQMIMDRINAAKPVRRSARA